MAETKAIKISMEACSLELPHNAIYDLWKSQNPGEAKKVVFWEPGGFNTILISIITKNPYSSTYNKRTIRFSVVINSKSVPEGDTALIETPVTNPYPPYHIF